MIDSALFQPFALTRDLLLRNRIVMAPMTTYSGNPDATLSDQEDEYYRRRVGGVGLVITGCGHVSAAGVGFKDEFAAFDDRFLPSLRRLAEAAKSGGAPAILQIFHAGVKALPHLVPDGDVVGPSDSDGAHGVPRARHMSEIEIEGVIEDFAAATRRALSAGFDGVEIHGAHGFLLQNFLSPRINHRTDAWGGSPGGRLHLPLAVAAAARSVIDAEADRPFALGYRVSPEEPEDGGLRIEDVETLIDELINGGVDYIHASLMNARTSQPIGSVSGAPTIAMRLAARIAGRTPFIVAGQVRKPDQAAELLDSGISLVAVGQGLVLNPDWVDLARTGRADEITVSLKPSDIAALAIPDGLWATIDATKGWFTIAAETSIAA